MLGYLSILLGFAALIICSFKNISIYISGFLAALIVIVLNDLPFTETYINVYYPAFGGIFTSFFPIFLFGGIMAKLYAISGAAVRIANTICNLLFSDQSLQKHRLSMAYFAIIAATACLCYGGINSGVVIVTIYPIALEIFRQADIPKRFIMGAICGGAFTFALCGPGSPQLTNIAGMALGTSSTVGLIPGIAAIIVEIIVMTVLLQRMTVKAMKRGEGFVYGPKDRAFEDTRRCPGFLLSLLPLVVLFVLFNVLNLHIMSALLIACVLSAILFRLTGYISLSEINNSLTEGAASSIVPCACMGSVVGFASVIQLTDSFQTMVDAVLGLQMSPIFVVIISIAIISALTGGSTTGFRIALPIISPALLERGMSAAIIHRVGAFASTIIDSLPHSGAVIMAVEIADLKMKDAYPAVFVTTVIATAMGTATVALLFALFPGLA